MVTADRLRQNQHKNRWENRRKKSEILKGSSLTYKSMQENAGGGIVEPSEEWNQFAYLKNHGWIAYLLKYENLTTQEAEMMREKGLSFDEILSNRQ